MNYRGCFNSPTIPYNTLFRTRNFHRRGILGDWVLSVVQIYLDIWVLGLELLKFKLELKLVKKGEGGIITLHFVENGPCPWWSQSCAKASSFPPIWGDLLLALPLWIEFSSKPKVPQRSRFLKSSNHSRSPFTVSLWCRIPLVVWHFIYLHVSLSYNVPYFFFLQFNSKSETFTTPSNRPAGLRTCGGIVDRGCWFVGSLLRGLHMGHPINYKIVLWSCV